MQCVTSVKYSVYLNSEVFGDICPRRGLRQGDHLSTYLFVLCAQGLSSIITKDVSRNLFKGVKMAASSPSISHFFFSFFFLFR